MKKKMEGIHFLKMVRERWPDTVRMILTGFCVPDSAYKAISIGDVSTIMTKPWDDNKLIQEIDSAFHFSDSIRTAEINQCDICGEKGLPEQIHLHHAFYVCNRCRNWYELLPDVVVKSLRRLIIGNVL